MKKWLINLLLVCFICQPAFAQISPFKDISIVSPTAAAIGKFGDIPVSYHSGSPQISVPIYKIKEGPLELPISLNYHPGGIRVMEPASWVGAGWALDAGGVISRSVQGLPDDNPGLAPAQTKGHYKDFGYSSYLHNGNFIGGTQDGLPFPDYTSFASGAKDGEPDLFSFSIAGFSGKFYFNDDRTPVIVPQQDIKIQTLFSNNSDGITGFILTTPNGVQYIFGKTTDNNDVDPVETTDAYTQDGGYTPRFVTSSWYLNKIVSADKQFSISLVYQTEQYGYFTISTFPVLYNNISSFVYGQSSPYDYKLIKNIFNGVRLQKITFSNGNVQFNAGNIRSDLSSFQATGADSVNLQSSTLGSIAITNQQGFCKKFNFLYDYFVDNTSALTGYFSNYTLETDKRRLRLLSVQETDSAQTLNIPLTVFEYSNNFLPRRLSFAQDHWGFYNGVTNNNSLIPSYTITDTTVVAGADRNPAWPAMATGSLKRIYYPTGGYSDFEFEPHQTWVNYTKKQWLNIANTTAGFGGPSTSSVDLNVIFSANPHKALLTNSSIGAESYVEIYNSNNQIVNSFSAAAGTSNQLNFSLPAGTYRVNLRKINPVSGSGATLTISELATQVVTGNTMVGGLRIKNLRSHDPLYQRTNTTHYVYDEQPGKSSGVLYSRPAYVSLLRNNYVRDWGLWSTQGYSPSLSPNGCLAVEGVGVLPYMKSASSIVPMSTVQGGHIGYREVKVYQTADSIVNISGSAFNGYSVYRYYGSPNWNNNTGDIAIRNINPYICDPATPNYPFTPLPFEYQRGELQYDGMFGVGGNLIKEKNYTYVFESDSITTPSMLVSAQNYFLASPYHLKTYRKKQTSIIERTYDESGSAITASNTSFSESSFHQQTNKKIMFNSLGDSLVTRYTYATDIRIPAADTLKNGWVQYVNDSITHFTTYNNTRLQCGGNAGCLTNALLTFQYNLSLARMAYIAYRTTRFTNSLNKYDSLMEQAKLNAGITLKPLIELRQQNQLELIEQSNWKNNLLLGSVFYEYNYAPTSDNKVYINKSHEIKLAAPTATFAGVTVTGTAVSKDAQYEEENQLLFVNGNIAEIRKQGDIATAYLYNYYKNEPVCKVTNAGVNEIAYTSFEATATGNWDFNSTGIVTLNALAITGKSAYNLSTANLVRTGLNNSTPYIISFWVKEGTGTALINGATPTLLLSRRGWALYQVKLSNITTVNISGNATIDEVRLYPANAQMTTYTYHPLVGMSSVCDVNNKIIYYEYDALSRLKTIRDEDGNIVKTMEYNYKR